MFWKILHYILTTLASLKRVRLEIKIPPYDEKALQAVYFYCVVFCLCCCLLISCAASKDKPMGVVRNIPRKRPRPKHVGKFYYLMAHWSWSTVQYFLPNYVSSNINRTMCQSFDFLQLRRELSEYFSIFPKEGEEYFLTGSNFPVPVWRGVPVRRVYHVWSRS